MTENIDIADMMRWNHQYCWFWYKNLRL